MDIESMPVRSRILSMLPSLQAAERRVAEFLLQHAQDGGDLTVSAVAAGSGASAGTVVRTCKSLGYRGYQQVRVLLARDRMQPTVFQAPVPAVPTVPGVSGVSAVPMITPAPTVAGTADGTSADGDVAGAARGDADDRAGDAATPSRQPSHSAVPPIIPPIAPAPDSATAGADVIRHALSLAGRMPTLMGMLSTADLDRTVRLILRSRRILIIASGLSAPIGQSFASRLLRCGIDVIAFNDVIDQHIAASMLTDDCTAFVISGSGVNAHSLSAARSCRKAGAHVVAMTYFAASPLTSLAEVALILEPPDFTLGQELRDVSRVALMILTESIGAAIEREASRAGTAFTVISQHLEDDED
ncbi:MurR/RpiR family transcriptional regulator [Bifidobacterium vespertilionis]|uniref:MurR/RpiR family transcriptional regulator n=1 Tax=Bifidobacterium vespertilionis TaxID=2562524 RepID=UPI001BDC9DB2|nr:MurR/RpiR family transcriptional regulator [Bifidobacterium vespertilionis]MBT1180003.1 MurR/RpiR family transcriptional regulator [Bifidobacterium vespertilionis]